MIENLEDIFNPDEEEDENEGFFPAKKSRLTKIKAGKDLITLFSKPEKEEDRSPETDKTPELDAEAPLEHLSQVEEVAISQTLAEERLLALQDQAAEELTSEHIATIDYLEAVISSGDMDQEYVSVAQELGVSEIAAENQLESPVLSILSEITQPTETLSPPGNAAIPTPIRHKVESMPESNKKETAGIVYFLMSRRKARLKSAASAPIVEKGLSRDVEQLRTKLQIREGQIRHIALEKEEHPATQELSAQAVLKKTEPTHEMHEQRVKPRATIESVQAEIQAQTITRNELLKIAASIEIEGTKLSAIFENNLLGEKGLRRVVAEFLRGGNVKKALRREMIERDIDFERDPILRDHGDRTSIAHQPTTLDSLLEKSGINWNDEQHVMMPEKPKKKPKTLSLPKPKKSSRPIKAADSFLVGGILILMIILVVIILSR